MTAFGRPVIGEIQRAERRAEQWTGEKFAEMLDALLAVEGVAAVKWAQYTPFFNDGEPCLFGVCGFSVKLGDDAEATVAAASDEDDDDYEREDEEGFHDPYDFLDYSNGHSGNRPVIPGMEAVYATLSALDDASRHFEDVLQATFGDHCEVTATRTGFHISEYSHD